MSKLTLNADKKVVEKAKRIAHESGVSVSTMFSQFVEAISRSRNESDEPVGPITRSLRGVAKASAQKTDRELYEAAILKKGRR